MSPGKWLLPLVESLGRESVIHRVLALYPDLSRRAKLAWARRSRQGDIRVVYHLLKQAEAKVAPGAAVSPSHLLADPNEWLVPPGEAVPISREMREMFARGAASLDLVMAEAMGLVFDGSRPFREDPHAYLLLPRQRPEGVPPMGLYVCAGLLHIFVSEQDISKVAAFIGPGVSRFLDEMRGDVRVMWHLFTVRPLALDGVKRAVEASSLPQDEGFVVWQWHQGGLAGAAGFSRDKGLQGMLWVAGLPVKTTLLESAEFLRRAQLHGRIPAPSVWKALARPALGQAGGPAISPPAAKAPVAPGEGALAGPGEAPPAGPSGAPDSTPSPQKVEPKVQDSTPVESKNEKQAKKWLGGVEATLPARPVAVDEASVERRPGVPVVADDKRLAEIAQVKERLVIALGVGNAAHVARLQDRLTELQGAE